MLPLAVIASYLVAIAAIGAMELFPLTGIVLWMFGGPLLMSLLANLMLVHVALLAAFRRRYRWWLVVPVAAYAAWFWYAIPPYREVLAKMAAREALSRLTEPVGKDADLVFDEADASTAAMAKKYIPGGKVFAGDYEIVAVKPPPGKPCFDVAVDASQGERRLGGFVAPPDYAAGACLATRRNPGPHPGLRLTRDAPDDAPPAFKETSHRLMADDGLSPPREIGRFVAGSVTTVSPMPLYAAGCALNSAAPKWQCFHGRPPTTIHYGVGRRPGTHSDSARMAALAHLLGRDVRSDR